MKSFVIPAFTFVGIAALAWLIFQAVARDYRTKGMLTDCSAFFETAIFFVHGFSSYLYLDSTLSAIRLTSPSGALAATLIFLGLAALYLSMFRLGWSVSIGRNTQSLRKTGPYRFSRNPQIVAYFFVVAGYSLLWPSLFGVLWVCLYLGIAHMMAQTEEAHLARRFGAEYCEYCVKTPRYIGCLQMS